MTNNAATHFIRSNVSQVPDVPVGPTPPIEQGYNGLFNPNNTAPNTDNFLYHGKVMVWSAGPDGKIDPQNRRTKASTETIS